MTEESPRVINPIKDKLLLRLVPPPKKTSGGLILPTPQFQERSVYQVVAVGPDVAGAVKPGEYVLLGKYSGEHFEDPDDPTKEYTVVAVEHVLGTLRP